MFFSFLQKVTTRLFSARRRALEWLDAYVRARPRLAAWVYPAAALSPEGRYQAFNERYFANWYEQERMLADAPRMRFYEAAIARHIRPGCRVIDLGTGTGILAALAARAGAAKVYAIEHSEILTHAREIAVHNHVSNVEFVSVHSTNFSLDAKVDVILHEQMGDGLFDEEMVANVADLRDRMLAPGGRILPDKFDLYCEPMTLNAVRRVPFLWEMNVLGYDYACMERHRPQEPAYYQRASSDPGLVDHFLGVPQPLLSIDLQTLNESDLPLEIAFRRTVVNAGRLDGYVVFFKAHVDDDLSLSSSPLDPGRAPHWGFRLLRTAHDMFEAGDEIEVRLAVGRWPDMDSWYWSHVKHRRGTPTTAV